MYITFYHGPLMFSFEEILTLDSVYGTYKLFLYRKIKKSFLKLLFDTYTFNLTEKDNGTMYTITYQIITLGNFFFYFSIKHFFK